MEITENSIKLMAKVVCGESRYAPFKSGPELVKFFSQFGLNDENGKGFSNRYEYTEKKLRELNGSSKLKEVIEKTLEPENFHNKDFNISKIVSQLNEFLLAEGYEVKKAGSAYKITYNDSFLSLRDKVKNIIFAPLAAKPEILISEPVEIVKNEESCLVYNFDIPRDTGLLWVNLTDWWIQKNEVTQPLTFEKAQNDLYLRLFKSIGSAAGKILFKTYYKKFKSLGDRLPALVPDVYFYNDPLLISRISKNEIPRMDFLILPAGPQKLVINIDSNQHFADEDKFSPRRYAGMMAADRKLKLSGYQVFRFGATEFKEDNIEVVLDDFFNILLENFSVK
jgi:hypothetical protein